MGEIAVKIIDPGGKQWARLLDEQQTVSVIIAVLVARLNLPRELNYQLVPEATRRPLNENERLAAADIKPGAELELTPIRDSLWQRFLDRLYKEIEDHIKDQLWELAQDKLDQLFRLNPNYPDPKGLRAQLLSQSIGSYAQPQAQQPRRTNQQTSQSGRSPTKSRSGCGCALAVLAVLGIVGVVATVVLVVAGGGFLFFVEELAGLTTPAPASSVVLGTGDVQVTLRWDSAADLDLHVIDPDGEEVWFGNRFSDSGGQLDVDANAGCGEAAAAPVENIFWPTGGAPEGTYQVYIEYFLDCDFSGPTAYELTIKVEGQVDEVRTGTIQAENDQDFVARFNR